MIRYHLQRVMKSHEMGLLGDDILKELIEKLPMIDELICEIEKTFDLNYPPIIIDPNLIIVRYPTSFATTVIYASTQIQKLNDKLTLCVEMTLPFLLFANKDLIKACLAHEFLHYIFATIIIHRREFDKLLGQKPISLEVLMGFDDTYLVKPENWMKDSEIISLIKRFFNPIIKDSDLEEKIQENWIKKSLPIKEVRPEDLQIRIPILEIDKISLDRKILEYKDKYSY
ncbi:MAG: hypothetical protein NZ922_04350 [Candidatus Methanomethyliaceae archaeon]|nr:hypothetical protein [Candidatus Methanomethyliaceae archaeon]MDW7971051.1 hypothetical protein [Nitrososphaerota archaeon]